MRFQPYWQALRAESHRPWLFYYANDGTVVQWSRAQFWQAIERAAICLGDAGVKAGDVVMLALTANRAQDLVWRGAAMWLGAIPATFNWQADDLKQLIYKIRKTQARAIIFDEGIAPAWLAGLRQVFATRAFLALDAWQAIAAWRPPPALANLDEQAARVVVFTSGTTGQPKGVLHSYFAYRVNQLVFERFLNLKPDQNLQAVVVNPLHHTNATAICDWAMRRSQSELHLFERYSSSYWDVVGDLASADTGRPVATLVSRHFDFLERLIVEERVAASKLKSALAKVHFLLGSAPVGPQTVARFQKYIGNLPMVRFGSTETCLQLIGTPQEWDQARTLAAFQAGWDHDPVGYFIGRGHPPWTKINVVRSTDRDSPNFMVPCDQGEPGYLVARTESVMLGYLNDDAASSEVMHDGWYLGLHDIGFFLLSAVDGAHDLYWMSRESTLLIRGGANYAYDQVAERLKQAAERHFGLRDSDFELAVVGDRSQSEHEDRCLVMWQSMTPAARAQEARVAAEFMEAAGTQVPKGMRPDAILMGEIPKNFKGAVLVKELQALFAQSDAEN